MCYYRNRDIHDKSTQTKKNAESLSCEDKTIDNLKLALNKEEAKRKELELLLHERNNEAVKQIQEAKRVSTICLEKQFLFSC